jgi:hypothetical protein
MRFPDGPYHQDDLVDPPIGIDAERYARNLRRGRRTDGGSCGRAETLQQLARRIAVALVLENGPARVAPKVTLQRVRWLERPDVCPELSGWTK